MFGTTTGNKMSGRSEINVDSVLNMASVRMQVADRILREVALISPETMDGGRLESMRVRLERCEYLAGEDGLMNGHVEQLEQLGEEKDLEWVALLESWMVKAQGELYLQKARLASMAAGQEEVRSLRQQGAGDLRLRSVAPPVEEIMKDNSLSGSSAAETAKKKEQCQQKMKQYEMQLKISENKAREYLKQLMEGKKVMFLKSQQEVKLGKESRYAAEIKKHGQTTEEIKRLPAVGNNTASDDNLREKLLSEEAMFFAETMKLCEECVAKVTKLLK